MHYDEFEVSYYLWQSLREIKIALVSEKTTSFGNIRTSYATFSSRTNRTKFATRLLNRSNRLTQSNANGQDEEDAQEELRDIAFMNDDMQLRRALEKARTGRVAKQWQVKEPLETWRKNEEGESRRIPIGNPDRLPAVLRIKDRVTRLRCLNWLFHRDPL